MKKKLMFLALGLAAVCTIGYSQRTVTTSGQYGPQTTGVATAPGYNINPATQVGTTVLAYGSVVTFTANGQVYNFTVVNTPASNGSTSFISDIANAISNAFNTAPFVQGMNSAGQMVAFGSDSSPGSPQIALQYRAPFDFGLSAVLCIGAFGAVVVAQKRRKEQSLIGA